MMETEGLFKVTSSHVRCKTDNILETVQDRDVVRLLYRLLLRSDIT